VKRVFLPDLKQIEAVPFVFDFVLL
jgi:hypothetical protein